MKLLLFDNHSPTKKGYPLKIRVTETKTKKAKYLHLQLYSFPETWNKLTLEPTYHHPQYKEVFAAVLDYKMRILKAADKANSDNLSIEQSINLLKDAIVDESSFSDYARSVILELKENGKIKTAEKKLTALNSLEMYYQGKIQFDNITGSFLKSYSRWAKNMRGMSNNGIHTYLAAAKSIYNAKLGSTAPFKGVMPTLEKTRSKTISISLMQAFYRESQKNIHNKSTTLTGMENCIDYFVLCFLLGGVDIIDIYKLRKTHLVNERIIFQRHKGGTQEWINNKVFPFAKQILNKYNSSESTFLLPANTVSNYKTFYRRYLQNLKLFVSNLASNEYISSKSPRYSFINYAKNASVPREVCSEIVGHATKDVHSIYESGYPDAIKNKYHKMTIEVVTAELSENK